MCNRVKACIDNLIKIQKQVEWDRDTSINEERTEILKKELDSIESAIDALNEIE